MSRIYLSCLYIAIGLLFPMISTAEVWQDPVNKVNYYYSPEYNVAYVAGGKKLSAYPWYESGQPDAVGNITIRSQISPGNGNRTYTVTSIGTYAFYKNKEINSITIPATIKTIGGSAFESCSSLTEVTLSEGLDSIGKRTFGVCRSLEQIDFPSSLRAIGIGAFWHAGLKEVKLPEKLQIIDEGVFMRSDIEKVVIGENIKTIKAGAFAYSKLKSIHIPASVTNIEFNQVGPYNYDTDKHFDVFVPGAFQECQKTLETITVDGGNLVYDSRGNALVRTSENKIYLGCSTSTIVSSVVGWTDYAFDYCDQIEHLVIPSHIESVTSFNQCENLKTVKLGSGAKYLNAFNECPNLEDIYIDNPVFAAREYIGINILIPEESLIYDVNRYNVLNNDTVWGLHPNFHSSKIWVHNSIAHYGLTDLSILDGVRELKRCAIGGTNLKTITLPESLESSSAIIAGGEAIGGSIRNEHNLERINIANLAAWLNIDWLRGFYGNPLRHCPHLFLNGEEIIDTLVVPEGITVLKKYAIPTSWVKVLDLPKTLNSIKSGAVEGEFDKVILHDLAAWFNVDMSEIVTYTDGYGSTREEMVFCNPLSQAKEVFLNNEKLTDIFIPEGIKTIKSGCFHNMGGGTAQNQQGVGKWLKSIVIPTTVNTIENAAFYNYSGHVFYFPEGQVEYGTALPAIGSYTWGYQVVGIRELALKHGDFYGNKGQITEYAKFSGASFWNEDPYYADMSSPENEAY